MKEKLKRILVSKKGIIGICVIVFVSVLLLCLFLFNKEEEFYAPEPEPEPIVSPEVKKLQIIDESSNTRPVAVMINNIDTARKYHSGLQDAYIVYEMIVEGGLTRLMAVYKDANTSKIGSIRSARHYYLDYVLENDAIYVHWGYSEYARDDISKLGINNVNGLTYENTYFYRDKSLKVSSEHTGFSNMELINKGIEKLGYRNTTNGTLLSYSIDDLDLSSIEGVKSATNVVIPYSKSVTTTYTYDEVNKNYKRSVNGTPHTDYDTKKQYTAKNIIVYQVANSTIRGDVKGRQNLNNIGSGEGYFISNGEAIPITWSKASRSAKTVYKLKVGTELKVNDGNTYIQIQPKGQNLVIS